jgi:lipopolysaccharide/colanic/teichoic acid biosynthesis glycosyltransferase
MKSTAAAGLKMLDKTEQLDRALGDVWRAQGLLIGPKNKRLLDITVAATMFPFAILVGFPLALAVWLEDRHAPFFAGLRVGKGWKPYRQFKIRSMVPSAEQGGVDATPANDSRITRVGHVIRRLKLDELPQLLNVFAGDMSLVGPRPNCLRECLMYSDAEKRILDVNPGITDISSIVFFDEEDILAAATTDPDLGYHQLVRPWKSRFCLLYIEKRSLRLDVELLLITGLAVFSQKLALRVLQPVLRRLGADDQLLRIARRAARLTPYPPPGLPDIVRKVPAKNSHDLLIA